jgi:predicted AlkP superfamily pyrophosphatase or phosphodiesterase
MSTAELLRAAATLCLFSLMFAGNGANAAPPRLVLQITVDGLRADLLSRYADSFVAGGFNYLLENGAVFTNAHYLHANTETIVGHTTLATGATPAVHGMIGNVWYHADSGELGYNIEDAQAPLLPTREQSVTGAQVDPAQKRSRSSGRSPRAILAPTFSDTLKIASAGKAKIFGIGGKDRSAVAMAGKTGTAYWYSTDNGDFLSSAYYLQRYPDWVTAWNGKRMAESFSGKAWELQGEPSDYLFGDQDDRPYEVDLKGYGRTFLHAFGDKDHPLFFTRLLVSPEGDRLLLDFGKALIEAEQLGQDAVTDYLSISFSAVDAVNHFFGPSSLENEAVVRQLDRTLADLLQYVDKTVGLEATVIVLSADHGMAEMPEYATELGHSAGRLFSDEVLALSRKLSTTLFGTDELVKDFFRPYLYLDAQKIAEQKLEREEVAAAMARELARTEGIGGAIATNGPRHATTTGAVAAVYHNHHPARGGDIYLFQSPYWFMFDRGAVAAMHGSPWNYDNHVPLIFAGPGIAAGRADRLVHPIDVAPSLSALLGISPPAAAQGSVLEELFRP